MMLGSTPDLPPGPATYLDPVEQVLGKGAQIVFGNLEGTLTTATASKCGPGGAGADCTRSAIRQLTCATSRTPGSRS